MRKSDSKMGAFIKSLHYFFSFFKSSVTNFSSVNTREDDKSKKLEKTVLTQSKLWALGGWNINGTGNLGILAEPKGPFIYLKPAWNKLKHFLDKNKHSP